MELKYEYRTFADGTYRPDLRWRPRVQPQHRTDAVKLNWDDAYEPIRFARTMIMLRYGQLGQTTIINNGIFCIPKIVDLLNRSDRRADETWRLSELSKVGTYLDTIMITNADDTIFVALNSCCKVQQGVFEVNKDIEGFTDPDGALDATRQVEIICIPQHVDKMAQIAKAIKESAAKSIVTADPQISIVSFSSSKGLFLRQISMEDWPTSSEDDLALHYGDSMVPFHRALLNKLETTHRGIMLFHGEPGNGKTFYIRRLTRELCQLGRKVVIVPRSIVEKIQEPQFTEFMLNEFHDQMDVGQSAVFVVEDAEAMLQARDDNPDTAACVSALLNLTDGILNDLFRIQVIATFNVDLSQIDTAVLRKGRLIARRDFERLDEYDAKRLALHLGVFDEWKKVDGSMTLAEIYELRASDDDGLLLGLG